MVVEEKLQLFRDIVKEDADTRRRKELATQRATLKDTFEEHKRAKKVAAEAQIAEETVRIRREETLRVSECRQEARRAIARKERELGENLFGLVNEKLAAFRGTPAYKEYLVRKALDAKAFAEGESVQLYLDAEDQPYFAAIEAASGICPEISAEPLGGGIRAILPGRRICIENAWNSLLADTRASFHFAGGARA